jgi:hypothetical protein
VFEVVLFCLSRYAKMQDQLKTRLKDEQVAYRFRFFFLGCDAEDICCTRKDLVI